MRFAFLVCLIGFATLSARAEDNVLTEQEARDGWKLLFDGKTTDGWRGYKKPDVPKGWVVKDGALTRVEPAGDLITKDKYENFELLIDWKFPDGKGNSGVIYHACEDGANPYDSGPEMQVLMPPGNMQKPGKNDAGSFYDVVAPSTMPIKTDGSWNTFKIICNGSKVQHFINGEKVVDIDTASDEIKAIIAKSKWAKVKLYNSQKTGYIDLQEHDGNIAFKNIKIKVLPSSEQK